MNYPADTTVIALSRPFKIDGEEVSEITMREQTVRDKILFEKSKGTGTERELAMIASVCGFEAAHLITLPSYDYERLVKAFNDFLLPPEERQKNVSSPTSQE